MTNLSKTKFWAVAAMAIATCATTFTACKKDEDSVSALSVSTIKAGGKDLNSSTPPQDVPIASNIVIRFNRAVNAGTATSANVMLLDSKNAAVPTAVSAAGDSVTINPTADLTLGSNFTLKISTGLKAADGGMLAAEISRQFKAYGPANIDPPQLANQTAYWNFNGATVATMGGFNVSYSKNTYGTDRFGFPNAAASFNGVDDIIEIDNGKGLFSTKTTTSYWVKFDTVGSTQGDFVMGMNLFQGTLWEFAGDLTFMKQSAALVAGADTVIDDLFNNGDGSFAGNGGWMGIEFAKLYPPAGRGLKTVFKDKWIHVVSTLDPATKKWSMYFNGDKAKNFNFNNWPAGEAKRNVSGFAPKSGGVYSNKFAFGFGQARDSRFESPGFGDFTNPNNNHFKGLLDDVRFFNAPLTDAEVLTLYNAEKVR